MYTDFYPATRSVPKIPASSAHGVPLVNSPAKAAKRQPNRIMATPWNQGRAWASVSVSKSKWREGGSFMGWVVAGPEVNSDLLTFSHGLRV